MFLSNTYPLGTLCGREYKCQCGKIHRVSTREVLLGADALRHLGECIQNYLGRGVKVALVCEGKLYNQYGAPTEVELERAGVRIERVIFNEVASDIACAKDIIATSEDVRAILGVGGGAIADLTKYAAAVRHLPSVVVATSPSTDGYLAPSAMLKKRGFWEVYALKPPIICAALIDKSLNMDTDFFAAGLGSIISKVVSLFDWEVANKIYGEHLCPIIYEQAESAIDAAYSAALGLRERDVGCFGAIFEQNLRLGLLMQAAGNSRLACGAETHTTHALDMLFSYEGQKKRGYSETQFLCANIVNRFYLEEIKRVRPVFVAPPDNLMRLEKICEYFGVSERDAIGKLQPYPEPKQLRIYEHKLNEYSEELIKRLEKNQRILSNAFKLFRRAYNDCGYWIKDYLDQSDIELALALAPDIREKSTFLQLLKHMGELEKLL